MWVDHDKLVRFVTPIVGTDDAEDVAQEVYLKLLQPHAEHRGQAGVETWVFAIAKNVAMDWLRKRGRDVSLEDVAEQDEHLGSRLRRRASPLTVLPEELPESLSLEMRDALRTLTPRQREALLACARHDNDTVAAAAELKVSRGVYAKRLHAARARMKELL